MKQPRVHEALLQLALQRRNLAKLISQGMPGAASHTVTLAALDGQWLKLLQAEGPPRARRVTRVLACPVQGDSAEQIQQRLRKACATEDLVLREVLLVNPTHLSTVRLFSLPSTDSKEIRDIVELQAEKHTPYAKEEILTDFKVIDRQRSGYSRVLLVIAHQDVIHRAVRMAEASGWAIERVGCELEGLTAWSESAKRHAAAAAAAAAKGAPPKPAGAGTSLVVDVDSGTTTLLAVHQGQPQFQRSLATGIEQLEDDPAGAGQRLVGELQRSIEAIEAEGAALKIQDVLLTGPTEQLGGFRLLAEQGLDLPVALVSPWQGCELSETARGAIARLPDVSFAGLIGLAASPGELDLTPQATKLRQAFEARAKALVLLGCQFIGALILVSLLFVGRAQKQQRYYAMLKTLYEHTAAEAVPVEQAIEQLEFIEGQLRQRGQLLKTVDMLAKLSPENIQRNTLSFTLDESVVLGGTADELPKVYEFSGSVSSSPLFKAVEVRRVTKRKGEEKDLTDFELRCPLAGAKGT